MANYFVSYSNGYCALKNVFVELMKELKFETVEFFDGPDLDSPASKVVEQRIRSCHGLVVLYGPPKRPARASSKIKAAPWPNDEFFMGKGAGKPWAAFVHSGTPLSDSFKEQTPPTFDFWNPADFQKNLGHIVKHLLDLKDKVDRLARKPTGGARARRPAIGPATQTTFESRPGLFRGYLHPESTLFHEVPAQVRGIADCRIIPTKYLFAHADSVDFYRDLLRSADYTIAREGDLLFQQNCQPIARSLSDAIRGCGKLRIVSLGLGMSKKEVWLLQHLRSFDVVPSFLGIDINPAFIKSSLSAVRDAIPRSANIDLQFVIGDFDHLSEFASLLDHEEPMLFLALGGTFGNQNEHDLLTSLRSSSAGPVYLLLDYQTTESLRGDNRGGYESQANRKFIQQIIRVFYQEEVELEDIKAPFSDTLVELRESERSLTVVDQAKTIVMVGMNKGKHKRYVGYSTRYDDYPLKAFLKGHQCEILLAYSLLKTRLLLCKLGSSRKSVKTRRPNGAPVSHRP